MEPIKIAYFTKQKIKTALEYLRVIGPISYTNIELLKSTENNEELFEFINQSNLIVIQRDFPADYNFYNTVYKFSRELNVPIVYDLDDNLLDLPENHPDRKSFYYSKALMPMLQTAMNADFITVANKNLKEKLREINNNIFILPNYLDDRIWPLLTPKNPQDKKVITIGYMGGDSHKPDLEMITPTLCEIKDQNTEKTKYFFYGIKPPEKLLAYEDTVWKPVSTYQYEKFAEDFQQSEVDIFIAPLIDNGFNNCKSSIKFLEYSSMGIPGVYSNVDPYKEIIIDYENGLLAQTSAEWYEKILFLINNPQSRFEFAKNAQITIENNHLMSENSELWINTYKKIISRGVVKEKRNYSLNREINKITNQLNEYNSYFDKKFQKTLEELHESKEDVVNLSKVSNSLQNQVEAQKKEIQSYKEEILYYALSKSWRFTRPMRKLIKFLKGKRS